ncbi:MAG: hypothetical protein KJ950_16520 [Proteobacteria bacterium]|nr:hypothetical protein [Pseudomonadota bacterium]MBU1686189.1 hypothetical protein [Pseudomonadota bacterium]
MSEEVTYVPAEVARKVVGEIVDEEHLHEENRRVLTVYDVCGREICWFDTLDVMKEIGMDPKNPKAKEAAVEYIFGHIPKWAVEDVIRNIQKQD